MSENNEFMNIIKEFIEDGAKIILTPRPRRFGKTLNLSMLRYFFGLKTFEKGYFSFFYKKRCKLNQKVSDKYNNEVKAQKIV